MTQQTPLWQEDVTSAVDVILQDKLEKSSITEQVLSDLREELKALQGPIPDKQRLALVQGGITKATNYRNNIVRICKKGRENALMEQRAWIAKEKELVAYLEEFEKPLRDAKQAYLDEQERIEREVAEAKARIIRERVKALEGFGFTRRTGSFPEPDTFVNRYGTTITTEQVETQDGALWGNLIRSAEQAWQEEQDRIAAQEEAKRQEEERLRREREELAAREAELARREKQMQDAINTVRKNELLALGCVELADGRVAVGTNHDGRGALRVYKFVLVIADLHSIPDEQWKDEVLAAKAAIEELNLAAASAKEREKQQARHDAMVSAGYGSECGDGPEDGCAFTILIDGKPFAIDHAEAYAMGEEDFAALVRKGHEEIQRRKLREQEAIRKRAIEEERQRQEAEAKRKAEDEERRKAQLSDAQKWQEWVAAVQQSAPKMSSQIGAHAVKRVISGLVSMTPGLIQDLNK